MAINRLLQARQMRKGGGIMGSNAGSMLVAPTADGSRPGYYGADFGFYSDEEKDKASSFQDTFEKATSGDRTYITDDQGTTAREKIYGGASGLKEQNLKEQKLRDDKKALAQKEKERVDQVLEDNRNREPKAYQYGYESPIVNPYKYYDKSRDKFKKQIKETKASKFRKLALKNLIDKKMGNKSTLPSAFEAYNLFNPSMIDSEYTYGAPITTDVMNVDPLNYMDEASYGITGKNLTDIDRMNRAIDKGRYGTSGQITQEEFKDAFYGDKYRPVLNDEKEFRDDQNPLPYILPMNDGKDAEEEEKFDYRFGTGQKVGRDVTLGYAANGGRITRAGGGIMNAIPRQGYFLGKIVKGVGKAIGSVADAAGKVLKSDFGKMALLAAGAYYMPGYGIKATGGFSNMMGADGFFKTAGKKLLLKDGMNFKDKGALSLGKILGLSAALPFIPGLNKVPENEDIGMGTRGGRLIDPLTGEEGTPASMRANIENAKIEAGGDPVKLAQLNQKYNNMLFSNLPYENYGTYAQGGRIRAEEGGLMNLGGMEKDYRAEGGFVPIGKQEKADDVPARLSVNEFVFTADAVRNAGGGDIDKGAEVMENMMKNLENGGTVSEESQGNTGAQQMFSVSERIGEVI